MPPTDGNVALYKKGTLFWLGAEDTLDTNVVLPGLEDKRAVDLT